MSERILAIVVTFNPDCHTLELALKALEQQKCEVLVVDNGSDNLPQIELVVKALECVSLESLARNAGLGAAHNVGIGYAKARGYDYILIMDQDSVPLDSMVANLLIAHKIKSVKKTVSAVGVSYLNSDNGSESFFIRFGRRKFVRRYCRDKDDDGCIEADFLISSGSLLSIKAIDSIGEMDEGLFIDHVDTEWFLRAKAAGFTAYGVCEARMQHGLGETTHTVALGGRERNVPQHKPFRYYYIFRNSVLLYKRSYASSLWKWNDSQRLVMIAVMFGVFKAPRWRNLSMMLKGIWHGLCGKTGPLHASAMIERDGSNG